MSIQWYGNREHYSAWIRAHDTLSDADRHTIRERIRGLHRSTLFSIILLPATDETRGLSQRGVASVRGQLYPYWELWLPEDLRLADADGDRRLRKPKGNGPSRADAAGHFNAAVAQAEGAFIVPLPADLMLAESALYELAVEIANHPDVDLLYTDEDCLDASGSRCWPHFKTGWDPDLALGRDAIGCIAAYRKTLLDQIDGMRSFADDGDLARYDLSLRVAFATSPGRIRHVPFVGCHRLANSPRKWSAAGARDIVRERIVEQGVGANIVPAPLAPMWNRLIHVLPEPVPLVSIIVPTRDRAELLVRCADGVLSRTDYPRIELLIVDNDSQDPTAISLLRRLSQDPRVRIIGYSGRFNYAAQNNLAAREARGDILVLLNNDTDVIRADWLREMVSHAVRPGVGAVGAKLFYADERVQHAGVVLGPGRSVIHQLRLADRQDPGPAGELALTRTVSAVTGACLALRRSNFFEVGGLNEELRVAYNDIDLCLRLGDHGYRIVWTPFAELYHLECATRGYDDSPEKQALAWDELTYFCRFWNSLLNTDPFHNPNVVYGWESTVLSTPPRRVRAWVA
jgi:O-antigen biosynthesis protein